MCLQSLTLKGCRFMVTLSDTVMGKKCKMAPDGETTLNPSKCLIEVPARWLVRVWRRHSKSISCLKSSLMPEVTHPGK